MSQDDDVQITLRPFQSKIDEAFIYATWLRSYYSLKPRPLPKDPWFKAKAKEIKEVIAKSSIKIACFKDSPQVILGYVIYSNNKREWSFIKTDYRDIGLEQLLNNQVEKYGRNSNPDSSPEETRTETQVYSTPSL